MFDLLTLEYTQIKIRDTRIKAFTSDSIIFIDDTILPNSELTTSEKWLIDQFKKERDITV